VRDAFSEESKEIALFVPFAPIRVVECSDRTWRAATTNAREQRFYVRSFAVPIPYSRFPIPDASLRANLVARPEPLRLRGFERGGYPSKVLAFTQRRRAAVTLVLIGGGGHLNHGQSSNWCR
jgi:hypothetical protein